MQENYIGSIKDLAKKSMITMFIMLVLCGLLASHGAKAAEEKTLVINFDYGGNVSSYYQNNMHTSSTLTSTTVDENGNYVFELRYYHTQNLIFSSDNSSVVYAYSCSDANIVGSGANSNTYLIREDADIVIKKEVFEGSDSYSVTLTPEYTSININFELVGVSDFAPILNPYGYSMGDPAIGYHISLSGSPVPADVAGALTFTGKWMLDKPEGFFSGVKIRVDNTQEFYSYDSIDNGGSYIVIIPVKDLARKAEFGSKITFTPVYEANIKINYSVFSGTLPGQAQTEFTAVSDGSNFLRAKITLPDVTPEGNYMMLGWNPDYNGNSFHIKLADDEGNPLPDWFQGSLIESGKEIFVYFSKNVAQYSNPTEGVGIHFSSSMPIVNTKFTYSPGNYGSLPADYIGTDSKSVYSRSAKITYGNSQTISPKVSVTFPELQIDETSDKDFVGYKLHWDQRYAGNIIMVEGTDETEVNEDTVFSRDNVDLYLRSSLYEGDGELISHLTFDAVYTTAPVLKVRYGNANQNPVNVRPTSRTGGNFTYSVTGINDTDSLASGMTRVWMIPELPSGWECKLNGHSDYILFFFGGETLDFKAGPDSYTELAGNGVVFESREAIATSGTYEDLTEDREYLLKEGTWTIDGDGYTYNVSERTEISFLRDGTYTFRKIN
jgi:hypothetical protein